MTSAIPTQRRNAKEILTNIYAFAPNRDTLGGTAYLIRDKAGNILIDTPAWNEANQQFLQAQGGVSYWIITHRNGIGKALSEIHQAWQCPLYLQEQEAYCLPHLPVVPFGSTLTLENNIVLWWTPGYSPGSSCVYYPALGGVLFSGRHLLPDATGTLKPLRMAKTFHWPRQLRQVKALGDHLTVETLRYLCPGANTWFLRGRGYIDQAYDQIAALDLSALAQAPVGWSP